MDNNKKNFITGIALGIVVTILAGSIYNTIISVLTISGQKAADPNQKLRRIISVLKENYVDTIDVNDLYDGMYAGLVYGVGDPYTSYFDEKALTSFKEQTEGTYAGIGVVVTITTDNRITVISPFEGAPGAKAGILPNDKIMKVNGHDVYGENYEEAITMMKGEPNTSVKITLFRPSNDKTFDVDVIREQINIPTVSHKMLENDVGYIRVTNFERVTYDQFVNAYHDLTKQKMKGLIIDLRNNPGGLLDIVTKMTDILVPEGYIVYTEDNKGNRDYTYSDENKINVPLAILVNGNSASASEVMSGAVKDMGVGVLVGTQTFGKGLVQNLFDLRDGTALKITIAKYYTPSGICINGEGITPDYIVEMPDELSTQISNLSLEEDVQLQKAIEVINNKVTN